MGIFLSSDSEMNYWFSLRKVWILWRRTRRRLENTVERWAEFASALVLVRWINCESRRGRHDGVQLREANGTLSIVFVGPRNSLSYCLCAICSDAPAVQAEHEDCKETHPVSAGFQTKVPASESGIKLRPSWRFFFFLLFVLVNYTKWGWVTCWGRCW